MWKTISVKGYPVRLRILNLKHQLRFPNAFKNNFSFLLWQLFTAFDGISKHIGKADGKSGRVNRKFFYEKLCYGEKEGRGI